MGLLDVPNPRDTYADKILREASVNYTENQRQIEGVGIWKESKSESTVWML